MKLLRLLGIFRVEGKVHDFTREFQHRKLTHVKYLDSGNRVFVVGHGSVLRPGDTIVVRPEKAKRNAAYRYKLNAVQILREGGWRAYGELSK